jgi:hypothetical protein
VALLAGNLKLFSPSILPHKSTKPNNQLNNRTNQARSTQANPTAKQAQPNPTHHQSPALIRNIPTL